LVETINIASNLSLEEKYIELKKQLSWLLNKEENLVTNLANFTAAVNQTFEKISWVGFYLASGNELYLGPFQGKVACTKIKIGQGVCGTSAQKMETVVVPDVNEFPGHIFCDADSKSEIVIPMLKDNKFFGVLDIDSNSYNSFNEIDKKYLEDLVEFLSTEIIN
jgi:L-methionine (R)-S-oxide reductase